jgi:predicted helicase
MTSLDPNDLRGITSFDDVIEYLVDELDWPIDADDLEEATFEWDPDELGIPADRVPHLASLRQLRPLETDQPWGIFFLEFDGPRLPLTALRRLLDKLVTKKRATGSGTRRTWDLNDLLFIITTSTGDTVELHFIAFFEQPDKPAEIRSIPWRPGQSPAQHLKRLATELLPHLAWPDDPADISEWRDEWRSAFKLRHGEAIASATRLADRMADTAQGLRREVAAALTAEKPNGPFNTLMGEVREQLVGSVTPATFADMCAQTLVYGVLTSRITDPASFGASPTLAAVPLSNPFLAAFFDNVHDQASVLDLEGIGLEQLVADLRETNVEAILDQFGASARGGDPVIHFYEEFLQRYDRKMRADAGAFYTPQPVVEFMTRTVDTVLRDRFGLASGVADGSTWAEVAERNGFAVPEGVEPSSPFVSMVDPATGTGTFVVEWLRRARASFLRDGKAADWPEHARDVVLPSLHAFELMLGPYAIAHLKVALELHDEDVVDDAPNILLTDTLDHESHNQLLFEDDPVSGEGERAAALKDGARFTVVVGNPPYDREQQDVGSTGKRKGGIARYGVPGVPPLMNAVLEPLSAAGLGKHAKNAYNDYVYFWCWAAWQAVTKRPGPGVVALITASSYLDGVSLGGLRSHLRDVFDELWIVDLGGEGRGARVDENVFAIRTPVTIAFGIRTGSPHKGCEVRYLAVEGTRDEKLAQLGKLDLLHAPATEIEGEKLDRLTPSAGTDYSTWPEITDLFPWIHSGSQIKRVWPIAPSKSALSRRWAALLEVPPSQRRALLKETRDRTTTSKVSALLKSAALKPLSSLSAGTEPEGIERYGYRSFDRQWLIADARVADYPRPPLWDVRGGHQTYLTTLTSTKLGAGPSVTATPYVPDLDHFRGSYGAKNVMPLYRDRRAKDPNVTNGLLEAITEALAAEVEPEHLLAYVYGLTGSAAFTERFADELGEAAGPVRIPITADAGLFDEVVALGEELLWLHTWGERFADGQDLPTSLAKELTPVSGAYPEKFTWDAGSRVLTVGSGSFGPVDREVWEFEVSGLKVLQSWLGYRMKAGKGKKSSPLDDIRPERWTFTPELLTLLTILEQTVALTPRAAELLDRVVDGDLIDPATLPTPTDAERKAPKA